MAAPATMDPREQFLARFNPQSAIARFPEAPKAQTQLLNLGTFLRGLHEKGGITRAPGSYSVEDLERLASVYARRSPEMLSPEGPFLGRVGERDFSIIEALGKAQAGRRAQAAVAPVVEAEPAPPAGEEIFKPGRSRFEDILRAIAEMNDSNQYNTPPSRRGGA